jgi:hypothetical protein
MRPQWCPPFAGMGFLLFLVTAVVSCQRFYIPVAAPAASSQAKGQVVQENKSQNKYFILRHGSGIYAMRNVQVDQQAQQLNFQVSSLPDAHTLYISPKRRYTYKRQRGEEVVLSEVHLYTRGTENLDTTATISLPLDSINKIEVIEFDKARTTTSYILGGIGYTLGAMTVAAVIVALTKSSCPFVSVYDGSTYQVQGELFGGAIYPSLERSDYMTLRIQPIDGSYQIKISNELQEKQYTNFANLLVVTHSKDVMALADQQGNVYTVGPTKAADKAILNNKQDVTAALQTTDKLLCTFNDTGTTTMNTLMLHFDKPAAQKEAKLVLQLKNSYWFDFLYGEFTKAFGSYYNQWVKKQKKVPASELEKWTLEQHIPLQVALKTTSGWKVVDNLKTIGPLTNREVLVPLDLQEVTGDKVEVKLTTGFMFWELDYAGIDYSPNSEFTVQTLQPYFATDEKGANVLPHLAKDDGRYLDQPQPGSEAILKYKFDQPVAPGQTTTVILHTKGYYEHVRQYTGKPRIAFLKSFKAPGAFAAFSRQQYEKVKTQHIIALHH